VLWPGDTCPDNAVLDTDGWWFLDLEATDVRHAALAAAYTVLPFASVGLTNLGDRRGDDGLSGVSL